MATRTKTKASLPFPYPLPEVNPNWLTSTVVAIISGIREQKAGWDSLPILADALQDAGCEDYDNILCHLRGQTKHKCTACRRPGEKNYPTRVATWQCDKTGYRVTEGDPERPIHKDGFFPDRNGGCWEGTCWVVQLLSGNAQRVVAEYSHTGTMLGDLYTAPVLNPGAHDGDTWLVIPETYAGGPEYIVEAESVTAAEEIFVDDELGKDSRIEEPDLADYMEKNEDGKTEYLCHFTGSGTPYDTQTLAVMGFENGHPPFACRYKGPGIPLEGVYSIAYADKGLCKTCGEECYPITPHQVLEAGRFCCLLCYDNRTEH